MQLYVHLQSECECVHQVLVYEANTTFMLGLVCYYTAWYGVGQPRIVSDLFTSYASSVRQSQHSLWWCGIEIAHICYCIRALSLTEVRRAVRSSLSIAVSFIFHNYIGGDADSLTSKYGVHV